MRICSMLPSATEMLFALGLGDEVAGVTYACDFPPPARQKPVVVRARLPKAADPARIDRLVSEHLARGESIYSVDVEQLHAIEPDLIVTQELCKVCAVSPGDLSLTLDSLPRRPRVISLHAHTLADVWDDIRTLAKATGRAKEAEALVAGLAQRVEAVKRAVKSAASRPRVLCLEWLSPPYNAGHWVPEMVQIAGGQDVAARLAEPSVRMSWQEILATQPEVIVVMPCGYSAELAAEEFAATALPDGWSDLPAVESGHVFAVDASSYFSRPGPRLAEGAEILAQLIHPECASAAPPLGSVIAIQRDAAHATAARKPISSGGRQHA